VPSLYTALSAGPQAADARIYGTNTNTHVVFGGDIVEIVINNFDGGQHPVHLHGHTMQLVARAPGVFTPRSQRGHHPNIGQHAGPSPATVSNSSLGFTPGQDVLSSMPQIPMRRDTWTVAPNGYTVWRYRAQNAGVWLLHVSLALRSVSTWLKKIVSHGMVQFDLLAEDVLIF
jgi:iron transport multicopper oxidase